MQQFLNSIDLENEVDWLPGWLEERGLGAELERAEALRTALRELAIANSGGPPATAAVEVVNRAAARLAPRVDGASRVSIVSHGDALDDVVAGGVRRDARRQLGAAQGLPQLSLVVLRLLAEPFGRLVLDAAVRESSEDARLPAPQALD